MSFDLLNILLICSLGYGVLQIPLLISSGTKKGISWPVMVIILCMLWIQIEFLAVRNVWDIQQRLLFGTRFGSWFFLGPALLYYVKAATRNNYDERRFFIQLLPGLLFVFVLPFFLDDVISKRGVDYGMLTILAYGHLGYTFWQGFYAVVFIAQFIHLTLYLSWSLKELTTGEIHLKMITAANFPLKWMKGILALMVLIIIGSSYFFYLLLTSFNYYRYWDYFYALPFAVATYVIVFKLNRFPQFLRDDLRLVTNGGKYQKSSLDPDLLESYARRLRTTVNDQKLYLSPDLTLPKLAEVLNINPHHLSQVFNRALKTTFFDFINQQRVQEAQRLLLSNNQTMLEIAMKSGFATKASFNKYFKLVTGMTPTEYMSEKKK